MQTVTASERQNILSPTGMRQMWHAHLLTLLTPCALLQERSEVPAVILMAPSLLATDPFPPLHLSPVLSPALLPPVVAVARSTRRRRSWGQGRRGGAPRRWGPYSDGNMPRGGPVDTTHGRGARRSSTVEQRSRADGRRWRRRSLPQWWRIHGVVERVQCSAAVARSRRATTLADLVARISWKGHAARGFGVVERRRCSAAAGEAEGPTTEFLTRGLTWPRR